MSGATSISDGIIENRLSILQNKSAFRFLQGFPNKSKAFLIELKIMITCAASRLAVVGLGKVEKVVENQDEEHTPFLHVQIET